MCNVIFLLVEVILLRIVVEEASRAVELETSISLMEMRIELNGANQAARP